MVMEVGGLESAQAMWNCTSSISLSIQKGKNGTGDLARE
jgi:hypothetical protein